MKPQTSDPKLPPGVALIERLITETAAAINMRGLYGATHPRVAGAIGKVLDALKHLCAERESDSVTFLIVGDDLVADGQPLRKGNLVQANFLTALKRRGVERLTLARDLTAEETQVLLEGLAGGAPPRTTAHVIVGRVEIGAADPDSAAKDRKAGETPLSASKIDAVREIFVKMRADPAGGLGHMEEMIWGFIDSMSRTTREILPLAPLKTHDEYTFIHSINVSLLVLAQARSFGINGDQLHEIGLAALVHDIGKLSVPVEVLSKPGKLEGEDWETMKSHTEMGAWHLSGLESSRPLAILVAYEHHLRYDGQQNYPVLSRPRRPNFVSQMTSLADTYDAISTNRPYQKSQNRLAAIEILRKRSGSFHDPFLVGNFVQILGQA